MPNDETYSTALPGETCNFDALIIGAGFSGLYQLLSLRDRLGLSVRLLEAGDGVGGTWYWNRYPGARCDSESHAYAYYFSDELLQAIYEAAWEKGGLQCRAAFRDLLTDKAANDTAAEFIRQKIREVVEDPTAAVKLADIDHPFATKRPPIDTGYFETFNRDNVTLVDVRAAPIECITRDGIRTRDGIEHELDVIVFATGFDAMTGPVLRIDMSGRDGLSLREAWQAGPRTYLGLQNAKHGSRCRENIRVQTGISGLAEGRKGANPFAEFGLAPVAHVR
jgi:cation diffusion facilitator CzcD-associated flavoprotein CzcO